MGKSGKIIIAILIVAIIALAAVMLNKDKPSESSSTATNKSSQQKSEQSDSTDVAALITFDGKDFKLSTDRVMSGEKVKIVNNSQTDLEFDSDPHPVHTDNKELNVDLVAPGDSKTFTLTKKGKWGFHNHLKASQTGSITVE